MDRNKISPNLLQLIDKGTDKAEVYQVEVRARFNPDLEELQMLLFLELGIAPYKIVSNELKFIANLKPRDIAELSEDSNVLFITESNPQAAKEEVEPTGC